jgi:hypothetical protein
VLTDPFHRLAQTSMARTSLGWHYLGVAVRMAFELGLADDGGHSSPETARNRDANAVQAGRRTIWGCAWSKLESVEMHFGSR